MSCIYCCGRIGKNLTVKPCANGDCNLVCFVHKNLLNEDPGIISMVHRVAYGYVDINFCPMCGELLRSEKAVINDDILYDPDRRSNSNV